MACERSISALRANAIQYLGLVSSIYAEPKLVDYCPISVSNLLGGSREILLPYEGDLRAELHIVRLIRRKIVISEIYPKVFNVILYITNISRKYILLICLIHKSVATTMYQKDLLNFMDDFFKLFQDTGQ